MSSSSPSWDRFVRETYVQFYSTLTRLGLPLHSPPAVGTSLPDFPVDQLEVKWEEILSESEDTFGWFSRIGDHEYVVHNV